MDKSVENGPIRGRKVLLLCQQTDTLDIQPEWKAMLAAAGLKAAILRAAKPAYYGRVVALTNLGWALNNLVGLVFGIFADASSERAALFIIGVVLSVAAVALALWARTADAPAVAPAVATAS